jgi:hypothetical protein
MLPRRILYLQYGDPAGYPPLEHSSQILAERGWDVVLLGTVIAEGGSLKLRLSPHPRISVKTIGSRSLSRWQILRYVHFTVLSLYWILRWRPAWIYASDPMTLPALRFIRNFTPASIIYHEHDSPNPDWARSRFRRLALRCREIIGQEAELCVLPQQQRLLEFVHSTDRKKKRFAYGIVREQPRFEQILQKTIEVWSFTIMGRSTRLAYRLSL